MKEAPAGYCFSCFMCGDCCTGNTRITLNLYDLYKLTHFLGYADSRELFSRKWVKLVKGEHNVWVPVFFFKGRKFKFCPFLLNSMDENEQWRGLCSLHPDAKPLVCKLAPVGRIADLESGISSYVLVPPARDCPGMQADKISSLPGLKEQNRPELDYEYRYYQLLDVIKGRNYIPQTMLDVFYAFKAATDFSAVLADKERFVDKRYAL